MNDIYNCLFDFFSGLRGWALSITLTLIGYAPNVSANDLQTLQQIQNVNIIFQHTAWTLAILVSLLTMWVQILNLIDKYKKKSK
jgi:Na+/melibiose symporter-like transporter